MRNEKTSAIAILERICLQAMELMHMQEYHVRTETRQSRRQLRELLSDAGYSFDSYRYARKTMRPEEAFDEAKIERQDTYTQPVEETA